MKTITKITTMLFIALITINTHAQEVKTIMYECSFDCPSCEDKVLKNIPYEKGVKAVAVDYDNKQVTVSYKTSKNNEEGIQKALVKLGYETEIVGQATTFSVKGNCGMCKDKIEKAANGLDGVKAANWNIDSKELTVAFDASKISIDTIHQSIAASGYDTDKVRAEDAVYNNLHHCCKYDR